MNAFISMRGIRKDYPLGKTSVIALDGVDLDLEAGGFYSIVGPSGSGKSSLLYILGGMDSPSGGEMVFKGRRVDRYGESERTRLRAEQIGFVFQFFHLNPILTALENVSVALRFLGTDKRTADRKAADYLEKVGMTHRKNHFPAELSGGEQQRVALARAMVKQPSLLLADEPTGNLDNQKGMEIMRLLRLACRDEGTTVVQVTHNREMAEQSDRIITLRDGRIQNRGNLR
jgi:putative ABC transport system ATP-binding protein